LIAASPPGLSVLFVTRRTSGVGRRMESVVAMLQAHNRGRFRVRTVDADAEPALVGALGIDEIPAVVVVKGRRPVARVEGRATLEQLERMVSDHLSTDDGEEC
jgi:thioredoxin-like negative regulator of GroEL